MKIVGTDPGKTTGYAWIEITDRKIKILDIGKIEGITSLGDLQGILDSSDVLVIEDFLVRPQDAQKLIYQELHAPEAIGILKLMAKTAGIEVVVQSSSLKPVGYGWSGLKYVKGKKNMHSQDALAHSVYHAVKRCNAIPLG